MKWVNDDYSHNLRIYEKRDARKAIIVYCLILGSAFFQGWLYTTNLNVYVLNLSQIGIPLLITILFLYFLDLSFISILTIIPKTRSLFPLTANPRHELCILDSA